MVHLADDLRGVDVADDRRLGRDPRAGFSEDGLGGEGFDDPVVLDGRRDHLRPGGEVQPVLVDRPSRSDERRKAPRYAQIADFRPPYLEGIYRRPTGPVFVGRERLGDELLDLGDGGIELGGVLDRDAQQRPGKKSTLGRCAGEDDRVSQCREDVLGERDVEVLLDACEIAEQVVLGLQGEPAGDLADFGPERLGRQADGGDEVGVLGNPGEVRVAQGRPGERAQQSAVRRGGKQADLGVHPTIHDPRASGDRRHLIHRHRLDGAAKGRDALGLRGAPRRGRREEGVDSLEQNGDVDVEGQLLVLASYRLPAFHELLAAPQRLLRGHFDQLPRRLRSDRHEEDVVEESEGDIPDLRWALDLPVGHFAHLDCDDGLPVGGDGLDDRVEMLCEGVAVPPGAYQDSNARDHSLRGDLQVRQRDPYRTVPRNRPQLPRVIEQLDLIFSQLCASHLPDRPQGLCDPRAAEKLPHPRSIEGQPRSCPADVNQRSTRKVFGQRRRTRRHRDQPTHANHAEHRTDSHDISPAPPYGSSSPHRASDLLRHLPANRGLSYARQVPGQVHFRFCSHGGGVLRCVGAGAFRTIGACRSGLSFLER